MLPPSLESQILVHVVVRKVKCRLYVKFGGNLANQSLWKGLVRNEKEQLQKRPVEWSPVVNMQVDTE